MAQAHKILAGFSCFLLCVLVSSFKTYSQKNGYEDIILFKICRSKDANEIWYVVNMDRSGSLISENPILPFWIRKTENNKYESLTWIQNRYAYGIKIVSSEEQNKNELKFQIVSYEKRTFILRQISENQYKAYTISQNKEVEVTRIFVQIDGGSFWVPTIPFIKLYGIETQTGKEITETIIP